MPGVELAPRYRDRVNTVLARENAIFRRIARVALPLSVESKLHIRTIVKLRDVANEMAIVLSGNKLSAYERDRFVLSFTDHALEVESLRRARGSELYESLLQEKETRDAARRQEILTEANSLRADYGVKGPQIIDWLNQINQIGQTLGTAFIANGDHPIYDSYVSDLLGKIVKSRPELTEEQALALNIKGLGLFMTVNVEFLSRARFLPRLRRSG